MGDAEVFDQPSVQPPTREQIAKAIAYAVDGMTERAWDRSSADYRSDAEAIDRVWRDRSESDELSLDMADAVLALFPQSTPSAEPFSYPDVWNAAIDRAQEELVRQDQFSERTLRILDEQRIPSAQQPVPAEPVGIPKHDYIDGRFGDDGVCHATTDAGYPHRCYRHRTHEVHKTPPPATPEEGDRG